MYLQTSRVFVLCFALLATSRAGVVHAQPTPPIPPAKAELFRDTKRGDAMLAAYFRNETRQLADNCLAGIKTHEDWTAQRVEAKRQLQEMLGLEPWPERTPLQPVITGRIEHDLFTVEKLQFQSRPGMYVTGNLYLPKQVTEKLPAILYVCGHSKQVVEGVSYGNKSGYQHHGAWFARNGYVCLTIDTIQLGELQGFHHGTHNLNEWWWNARGYTPAGVEAWNGMRAIDYLQSRPEVDPERIGVTGRSGGGAYSWWIAALDERVKAAVPVAGITDLENHVVDGCVEGHCDCMYFVNTYRWDFAEVAALIAPRPLLISNTDKDGIFPLEGVVRVHEKARRIYQLYGAGKQLGLQITEGPHLDTQELHIHAFRWFNRFLKNDPTSQVEMTAVKFFEPKQLRVFEELPKDEITTKIQESFTTVAPAPTTPESPSDWATKRDTLLSQLRSKVFGGWPEETTATPESLNLQGILNVARDGVQLTSWDFTSEHDVTLRLYLAHRAGLSVNDLDLVVLNSLDDEGWAKWLGTMQVAFSTDFTADLAQTVTKATPEDWESEKKMYASQKWGMAWIAPRGVGPTAFDQTSKKQIHNRRRYQLLGQTLEGMQVWDIRRAVQALRLGMNGSKKPLWLQGERRQTGLVLYASLFEPDIARLDLWYLPKSHQPAGPDFLNVLRVLDIPEAVALAAERSKVRLYEHEPQGWEFPQAVAGKLGWDAKQIQVRVIKPEGK